MQLATSETPLVNERQFIVATRDTGYRSTAAAIAELVDNSIQATATTIRIFIQQEGVGRDREISVSVLDNGIGMDPATLRSAMQFAGSSRFDDRSGLGRFGMGLPNSSVSQARRVDVYTWQEKDCIYHCYLDVDAIASGTLASVPRPQRQPRPAWIEKFVRKRSGTFVSWTRCDRLDQRKASTIAANLHKPLGQRFRYFLWQGNKIFINNELVAPVDPLHLHHAGDAGAATAFGDVLSFEFRIPGEPRRTSIVEVQFSELPIAEWHQLTVDEKRARGISKGAGVSIVRGGREIDFGWYFMGGKRKENYDDWWRCEVRFTPELDELFGVTHSKQDINPTETLRSELTPSLSSVAQTLNTRARAAYLLVRKQDESSRCGASLVASKAETKLPPPESERERRPGIGRSGNGRPREPMFNVRCQPLDIPDVFDWNRDHVGTIVVTVNENHPFFDETYHPSQGNPTLRATLDCLLLSLARAEMAGNEASRGVIADFRKDWGNILAAYLGDR